jgi:hypothetical protein
MADLTFVQSDTAPSISGTLTDSAGTAIDLTGASVRFQMRLSTEYRYLVDAVATIVAPTLGTVRYDWVAGDLVTAGNYLARWQITFPDTTVQHTEPENTITVGAA